MHHPKGRPAFLRSRGLIRGVHGAGSDDGWTYRGPRVLLFMFAMNSYVFTRPLFFAFVAVACISPRAADAELAVVEDGHSRFVTSTRRTRRAHFVRQRMSYSATSRSPRARNCRSFRAKRRRNVRSLRSAVHRPRALPESMLARCRSKAFAW